jgi:SAM-dependent methyltransferase
MRQPGTLQETQHGDYFTYLMNRSWAGDLYRRFFLYPRLARRLPGLTLDLGCGIGDFLSFRQRTIGVDVNPHAVAYCRKRGLDVRSMSPDVLPMDDACFDSILLDNVLEHIAEPGPILAEIRRTLKPGGRLLVGVPGWRGWEFDPDHKVFYDEPLLEKTLAARGFTAIETFYSPFCRSAWLSRGLRQYCLFMLFTCGPQGSSANAS